MRLILAMNLRLAGPGLLLAALVVPAIATACSATTFVQSNPAPSGGADAGGAPSEGADGGSPRGSCDDYLACAAVVSNAPVAPLVQQFGANGTCWESDAAATAAGCRDACERGLRQLLVQFPEAVACGGVDPSLNPYGVRYPVTDSGTNARKGAKAGNRIKNFEFQGYLSGNPIVLTNVSLARFYDPQQRLSPTPIRLLHIHVASPWSSSSTQEGADFQGMADALRARGVAWLTVLVQGPQFGVASTVADLNSWVKSFPRGDANVLDPDAKNFGAFFDVTASPLNLWIDARSMEILSAFVGYEGAASLQSDADHWLTSLDSIPVKP